MLKDIGGNRTNWNSSLNSRPGPPLSIEVTRLYDRTCVMLHGELDDLSAPLLRDQLADLIASDLSGDLALDIAGVTFVDSTGLSVLIQLHKNLAARGRQLTLFYPTSMARRLLMITGLDDVLHLEPGAP
jgi:anti-sigma B factor antagonist